MKSWGIYLTWWKQILRILGLGDGDSAGTLVLKLIQPNAVIAGIKAKYSNPHTIRAMIQAIMKFVSVEPYLMQSLQDDMPTYKKMYDDARLQEDVYMVEKTKSVDGAVIDFRTLKQMVIDKFAFDSNHSLLIHLYEFAPVRDNFGDMLIVDNPPDDGKNYMVIPRDGDHTKAYILLRDYKTASVYGMKMYYVSEDALKIIVNLRRDYNTQTFQKKDGSMYSNGKMTNFVTYMLTQLGIRHKGSVNYIRRSVLKYWNEVIGDKNVTIEEEYRLRGQLAMAAGHRPITQMQYSRPDVVEIPPAIPLDAEPLEQINSTDVQDYYFRDEFPLEELNDDAFELE